MIVYQNRQFSLTKEGEYLLKRNFTLQYSVNVILQNIQNISDADELPVISIGSNPTIGEFILPGLISASQVSTPPAGSSGSFIGTSKKLEQQLHDGIIDFLISDQIDFCPELERRLFCSEFGLFAVYAIPDIH